MNNLLACNGGVGQSVINHCHVFCARSCQRAHSKLQSTKTNKSNQKRRRITWSCMDTFVQAWRVNEYARVQDVDTDECCCDVQQHMTTRFGTFWVASCQAVSRSWQSQRLLLHLFVALTSSKLSTRTAGATRGCMGMGKETFFHRRKLWLKRFRCSASVVRSSCSLRGPGNRVKARDVSALKCKRAGCRLPQSVTGLALAVLSICTEQAGNCKGDNMKCRGLIHDAAPN